MPVTCNVACVAPLPPPPAAKPVELDPTPPVPQAAPPDPASLNTKPSDIAPRATAIQVGGKQYTKVAGLTWVEKREFIR